MIGLASPITAAGVLVPVLYGLARGEGVERGVHRSPLPGGPRRTAGAARGRDTRAHARHLPNSGCNLVALGWSQDLGHVHATVVRQMLAESPVPVLLTPAHTVPAAWHTDAAALVDPTRGVPPAAARSLALASSPGRPGQLLDLDVVAELLDLLARARAKPAARGVQAAGGHRQPQRPVQVMARG